MPKNTKRKYRQVVDYIEDEVGVDIPRDVKKTAIESIDGVAAEEGMPVDLGRIGGTNQSAADLMAALQSVADNDELRIAIETDNEGLLKTQDQPIDASASEVDVDINSQTLSSLTVTDNGSLSLSEYTGGNLPISLESQNVTPLTVTDNGSLNVAGVVTVQEDNPISVTLGSTSVGIKDSSGTQIDPSKEDSDPNDGRQADLATGDETVGPFPVDRSNEVFISARSTGGGTLDVTVNWYTPNGNLLVSEAGSNIGFGGVTDGNATLNRKGGQVEVVFTDTSGNSTNVANLYVGSA